MSRVTDARSPATLTLRLLAVGGLVVALTSAALVLSLLVMSPLAQDERLNSPVAVALQMAGMAGLAVAGATLARQQPRAMIAWLMLATAVAWTLAALTLLGATLLLDRSAALAPALGWATNWSWVPAQGLTMVMVLRFPDGRLPGPRWRAVEWAVLSWTTLTVLATALVPGPLGAESLAPQTNPIGVEALTGVSDFTLSALFALLPLLVLAVCAAPAVRWRRAGPGERRALRWLSLAALVLALSAPLAVVAEAGEILQGVAFLLLPVAVGAAVLREELWDLDLRRRYDRLHAARLQERERLRRELHDGLGPPLGSVSMRAEAARNLLARGDTVAVDDLLASIGATSEQALAEVRRLIDDLGPLALREQDLTTALAHHARSYAQTFPVSVTARPDPLPPVRDTAAATAYLVVVEAVRNAARHSGGTGAAVNLRAVGADLAVEVCDDGGGLAGVPAGVGRTAMAGRVAEVGGALSVDDGASGGTTVRFSLPGALR